MNKNRSGGMMAGAGSLKQSDLLPFLNRGKDIVAKGYLAPAAVTLVCGMLLFLIGNPDLYRMILGAYLCLAGTYVTYRLCGKEKSGWVLIGAAAITAVLMVIPVLGLLDLLVFPLSGNVPKDPASWQQWGILTKIWKLWWGVGVPEELLKAAPVFLAVWAGRRMKSPKQGTLGVWEPLDGIVIAAASAGSFVLLETVLQYSPDTVRNIASHLVVENHWGQEQAQAASEVYGLQVLIPRMLTMLSGHLAWSGIFGYYIGLAVMRPRHKWVLLAMGLTTASLLHGLWDSFATNLGFTAFAIALASYGVLIAAILKARQISPSRADNFATHVIPQDRKPKAQAAADAQPRQVPVQKAASGRLMLRLGKERLRLESGARLTEDQIAGLASADGDTVVAIVDPKPTDMSVLGLKNVSTSSWKVTLPGGDVREVAQGRSVRLDKGTKFDFGVVVGQIE